MNGESVSCEIRVGSVRFRASASAQGITCLELPDLGENVRRLADLSPQPAKPGRIPDNPRAAAHLEALGRFLSQLLSGTRPEEVPAVDISDLTPFTRDVLSAVYRIPWGAVSSYGQVGSLAGHPGAARAVGGAVGRNPVGLVIPCHRVLLSGGSIGGWSGRPGWKEWLLELETGPAADSGGG